MGHLILLFYIYDIVNVICTNICFFADDTGPINVVDNPLAAIYLKSDLSRITRSLPLCL